MTFEVIYMSEPHAVYYIYHRVGNTEEVEAFESIL